MSRRKLERINERPRRVAVSYLNLHDWQERMWRAACAVAPELREDAPDKEVENEPQPPEAA